MNSKEIQALINLLDDPNEDVYETVTKNLLERGIEIIPELERAWENSIDYIHQERLETLINKIQSERTKNELIRWVSEGHENLLEGIYLIARFQYPDLQYSDINKRIEAIRKDVWLELNDNLTALEKVKVLNHILFDIHKFSKNTTNFYSPQNSYINQVLESRKGNPISLAIIYSVVSQRLGLPVYGVNLPKIFILAYKDKYSSSELYHEKAEDILFYINPYNKGAVLGKKEIDYFLKQHHFKPQRSFYVPCKNIEIIRRAVNNLIYAYDKSGYKDKLNQMDEIKIILESYQ